MHGFRWVVDFLSSDPARALLGRPFPVRFTDRLRRLNRLTKASAVESKVIAELLNINSRPSDYALQSLTAGLSTSMGCVRMSSGWQSTCAATLRERSMSVGRVGWARRKIATRWSIRPAA